MAALALADKTRPDTADVNFQNFIVKFLYTFILIIN
jgi:hypothetical protein